MLHFCKKNVHASKSCSLNLDFSPVTTLSAKRTAVVVEHSALKMIYSAVLTDSAESTRCFKNHSHYKYKSPWLKGNWRNWTNALRTSRIEALLTNRMCTPVFTFTLSISIIILVINKLTNQRRAGRYHPSGPFHGAGKCRSMTHF